MIEACPEGYIDGSGSNITLDIRRKDTQRYMKFLGIFYFK
jgi:hypothetical protein